MSSSSSLLIEQYLFNVTILQTVICTFGFLLNSPIIYITIKYKSLHSTYGYYLAISVFLDMLFEFSSLLPMVLMSMGRQISLYLCFFVQWYGTFSNCMVMMLSFFMGTDRLIAVLFPYWYMVMSKRHTLKMVLVSTVLAFLYAIFLVQFMFRYVLNNREKQVYCQITDIVGGSAISVGYTATLVLNGMIVGVYVLTGILIKTLKNQDELSRRVFRTLAVLISTIFALWLLQSLVVSVVLPLLKCSAESEYLVVRLMSQTVRIASAVNTPVLYFCSSEYRRLLDKEFRFLGKCRGNAIASSDGLAGGVVLPVSITPVQRSPFQNNFTMN